MDKRDPYQRPRPAITLSIRRAKTQRKSWLVSRLPRRIVELRGGPQRRPR